MPLCTTRIAIIATENLSSFSNGCRFQGRLLILYSQLLRRAFAYSLSARQSCARFAQGRGDALPGRVFLA
jgi:hypothetical protein